MILSLVVPWTGIITAQEEHAICKDLSSLVDLEMNQHQQKIDFRSNPLTQDYDLKYQRFEWELDPGVYYISGTVTTYFTPVEEGFSQLNFDFSDVLEIDSVIYHGEQMAHAKTGDDNLMIQLPGEIPQNQLVQVSVLSHRIPIWVSMYYGPFQNHMALKNGGHASRISMIKLTALMLLSKPPLPIG
jgi:hypothetical protein